MEKKYIQIGMIGSIALFFTFIAIQNIIAPNVNWMFVQHVLSMDTTFHDPVLMRRAITNSTLQRWIYYGIIYWETMTALLCWLGLFALIRNRKREETRYRAAKKMALMGLFCGFLLFMVGFVTIASEWFVMWQSHQYNGQMTAGMFTTLILLVMLFLIHD